MYGSVPDMVDRFGEPEMIQLSTPQGEPMETIRPERIEASLTDVSGIVDSYLRRRYAVPVAAPPPEIVRAAAHLARHDLALRADTVPTETMKTARHDTLAWLAKLADGSVTLDGALPIGQASFARTRDRSPVRRTAGYGAYGDPESVYCWNGRLG